MTGETRAPSAADQTRHALLVAALHLFGRQGFDGTSTRQIAQQANANIGSIAYHFGGKEALHAAVADFVVETMRKVADSAATDDAARPHGAQAARQRLALSIERMVGFLVASPKAGDIAQFVMREMAQPTAAFDRIYGGFFEPMHKRLCGYWSEATGQPAESDATRITIFTLIGQVLYFRVGREAVLRRLGWETIDPDSAETIAAAIQSNLFAILDARK